jgi:hypothetical protein
MLCKLILMKKPMKILFAFLLFLCCPAAIWAQNTATPPPAFHFNFQNAAGQKEFADETNQARVLSSVPLVVEHGALRVDYGAQITIPTQFVPDTTRDYTLCAWVAFSGVGAFGIQSYHPLFSKGFYPGAVDLDFAIGGGLPFFAASTAENQRFEGILPIGSAYGATTRYPVPAWVKSEPKVEPNQWTHLAVVREGDAIRIFKNGELVLEKTGAPAPIAPTSDPLYIGAERIQGESDNYQSANMAINDIRMYAKGLAAPEIRAIYQAERPRYPETYVLLTPRREYYPAEMQEYSYDLENKLKLTAEYEKHIPPDPFAQNANMTGAVQSGANGNVLLINGQETFPVAAFPGLGALGEQAVTQSFRLVRDFAAADVDLVTVNVPRYIFWTGEGEYDWTKMDLAFNEMIRANPRAKILAATYLAPNNWFIGKYPQELEQYYYNDNDLSAGLRQWNQSAPLSSQKWREVSLHAIESFVRHIESQPYAKHVYGYHIASGDAGEWYWAATFTGGMPGYSSATRDDFRRWLRANYHDDEAALQAAWQDKTIRFDTVEVPSPAERKATERGIFRDPVQARKVLDFRQYMNDTTFDIVRRSMETVKAACGGRKIASTYYGYPLLFAGKGETLHKGGLTTLGKVMRLESLDMMGTPVDYVNRRGGEPGMNINGFAGSARLHRKILWREEDLRTHFWPRFEFGRTSNTHESIGVITRDFGHALTNNSMGLWFMAMAGNSAFHQNAMMETIRQAARAAHQSQTQDRRSVAEVALIFDEKSLLRLSTQAGQFIDEHCWGTYRNASQMGAPFDLFLLDDIEKMPDYKLYVFLNAYEVDAATRAAIERKVRRNNAVAVWCYAPGYLSANGFDVDAMQKLTGLRLRENLAEQNVSLKPISFRHTITTYAKTFPTYRFSPSFEVDDNAATILAEADGKPALALREFNQTNRATAWRSVYSLMPLTKEMLSGLCDYAGVHLYSRTFDILGANKSTVFLHAVSAGEKEIDLPEKFDVYNALTNQKIAAKTSVIKELVPAQETRIYRLEK